jgi:hypothetical protein
VQAVDQLSRKSVQKLGISSGEDTCGILSHGVKPFRLYVIDICANGAHISGMAIVTVVETPEFQRRARSLMSEAERLELINFVARNPVTGVAIRGGRKFRFARDGGGKSGSYRVIHFFSPEDGAPIFLITVFAKNEKANLTPSETEAVKALGAVLAASYRRRT